MADFLDNFNADIDPLLMVDLGDEITFVPSSGGTVVIQGEFNEKFYLTDAETGVETVSPAVECLEADVINAQGGSIIRKGVSYAVKGKAQPDGTGMVLLVLRLA